MRILWLKSDVLLPLDKGGKLRTWHLMRHLARRHAITYLAFAEPGTPTADLDGVSTATLGELGFAYMKKFGATNVLPEPGKPQGFEETGSVSRDIPGASITAQSSNFSNHTYEMDADNLKEIGHKGFTIDAQAMTAILFDFATHPEYRAAVKKEFDGIKALFGEYQAALKKVYGTPTVLDPK